MKMRWEDRITNYELDTGFPRALFIDSTGAGGP